MKIQKGKFDADAPQATYAGCKIVNFAVAIISYIPDIRREAYHPILQGLLAQPSFYWPNRPNGIGSCMRNTSY